MSRLLIALLVSALISVSAHGADPAREKAEYGNFLETVKAMTTALKRTEDAGNPQIQRALSAVADRQKIAEELAAVCEYESARAILDDGYKTLINTLRTVKSSAASPPPTSTAGDVKLSANNKDQVDFERKIVSADALMQAAKRVDSEKAGANRSQIENLDLQLSRAKAAAAGKNWGEANRLLADVLDGQKKLIAQAKGDPTTAGLNVGSPKPLTEAVSPRQAEQNVEIAKTLRSMEMLRELIVRRSRERGVDNSATLGKIDQMAAEALRLQASDPKRALEAADGAYETAKVGTQTLFAK